MHLIHPLVHCFEQCIVGDSVEQISTGIGDPRGEVSTGIGDPTGQISTGIGDPGEDSFKFSGEEKFLERFFQT